MRKFLLSAVVALGCVAATQAQELTTTSVGCIPATALSCTDDPLHPIFGQEYEYSVDVTPPEGEYTWFVTTKTNIIDNSSGTPVLTTDREAFGGAILASGSGNYNVATLNTEPNANKVKLTWKGLPATATDPILLVMYAKATGAGCSDNLKVYKIEPKNGFSLEIANIDPTDGTTTGANADATCVSNVESATFDGTNMTYDYGENNLYFVVNAANFSTSWTPSFQVDGLQTGQTATVEYVKSNAVTGSTVTWEPTSPSSGGTYVGTAVTPQVGTSVGETGECIVVKVTVDHANFELIADLPITLKVDGVTAGGQKDVKKDCTDEAPMTDSSVQTIKKRATIANNTAGGTFIPKN